MKDKLIHLCLVIDESGSMYDSVNDVIGGFKKTIDEQKAVKDGDCIVSLYTFASDVKQVYLGKKLEDVGDLDYHPGGMTKLLDGIGTAIDEVGTWLADMKEEDRPSKNMIVIITDGEENYSNRYKLNQIKDMIKHQENKYNWSFIYLGNDLSNSRDADSLGFNYKGFTTKAKFYNNYDFISTATTLYRCASTLSEADASLKSYAASSLSLMNAEYEKDTGIKINDVVGDVDTPKSATYSSIDASETGKKRND